MANIEQDIAHKKEIDRISARFTELKAIRAPHENRWRKIAEYIALTSSDGITKTSNELRARNLVDATGAKAAQRLIGVLHGHMINPGTPWAVPKPSKSGVEEEIDADKMQWLDNVGRKMQSYFLTPSSNFTKAFSEFVSDLVHFATAYVWQDHIAGRGPVYRAVSHWNCWIDENEYGEVDTVYREFKMAVWRAARKYPENKKLQELLELRPNDELTLLHIVEPRLQFFPKRLKSHVTNRAFVEKIVWLQEGQILMEGGKEKFPWAVSRFMKRPDEKYGYGPSDLALPDVILANAIMESVLRSSEALADPPIMMPTGFMIKKIDRRPGAVNYYDAMKAAVIRGDPVGNLLKNGDPQMANAVLQMAHDNIETGYYVDWLTLPTNIAETATAVNDRRELRSMGLSHMVTRQESEALEPMAEHCFMGLMKEDWFDEPPEGLDDIEFTYRTPLTLAMMRADMDAVSRLIAIVAQVAPFKPEIANRIDADKLLEFSTLRIGYPYKLLTPPAKAREMDDAMASQQEETNLINNIASGAGAAADLAKSAQTLGAMPEIGIQ